MRLRFLSCLCLAVLPAAGVSARADQKEASTASLGKKIANLTFQDQHGKSSSLHDLTFPPGVEGKRKATVIVFLSFECPVSNSYCEPLANMHERYRKYGVSFIGLTTNEDDSRAQVAKQARDFKVPFPVFRDEKLAVANALKADATPECFVLDGDFVLRYRGRIDNSFSERLKKHAQVTEHNLEQAISELLTGRPVSVAATIPVGCPIVRHQKATVTTGNITYHRDVQPILQNHCQSCHRPGEVGPFSLMTYKQAVNWADDIKTYTQNRFMPPWKLTEGVPFHNDRRIADQDIATLAAWVEGGCPQGDPKDAPPARTFPEGWQLGTPDLVLTMPDEFQLGPTGRDLFRCFVLPTDLPEDRYIGAVEIRPSNPRIVHHVLLFVDGQGKGRKLEQDQQQKKKTEANEEHPASPLDGGPGYTVSMGVGFTPQGGMGGWAPGNMPRWLPESSGFFLPKKGDVIMQVHYHRNGRLEKDRSQIGLYFAKGKANRPFQGSVVAGSNGGIGPFRLFFSIPAGDERFHLQGDSWATQDCTLYSISPHMHMLGKEMSVTMTPPDGPAQTLLAIKEWDYNWQEAYLFKEPLHVKAGTRFHVDAVYDNSSKNPRNPFNPPRRVTFGEQTFNEMCFVFMGGLSNRYGRALPMTPNAPKKE